MLCPSDEIRLPTYRKPRTLELGTLDCVFVTLDPGPWTRNLCFFECGWVDRFDRLGYGLERFAKNRGEDVSFDGIGQTASFFRS